MIHFKYSPQGVINLEAHTFVATILCFKSNINIILTKMESYANILKLFYQQHNNRLQYLTSYTINKIKIIILLVKK